MIKDRDKKQYSVLLDKETVNKIDYIRKKRGSSRSRLMRNIIIEWLDRQKIE